MKILFLFATSFIHLLVGIIIVFGSSHKNKKLIITFFFFCLIASLWTGFFGLTYFVGNSESTLFLTRIIIIPPIFIPIVFNYIINIFPDNKNKINPITYVIHFILIVLLVSLNFTDYSIYKAYIKDENLFFEFGFAYIFFDLYVIISLVFSAKNLLKKLSQVTTSEKLQIKYIFFGILISLFFSLLFTLIFPTLGYPEYNVFAPLSSVFFIFFFAFAIIRHRLLDIEVIISHSLAKIISSSLYLIVFLFVHWVLRISISNYLQNYNLMLTVSFIFMLITLQIHPAIQSKIQTIPDSVLLKDFFNIPETSKYFSEKMGKAIDQIEFFRAVEHIFLNVVGCSNVKVYLREDFQTGKSELVEKYFLVNQSDARMNSNSSISIDNPLIQKGKLSAKAIIYDEEDFILQSELEKLNSKIFIPCLVSQGEILGIVLLSEKLMYRPFTNNDLTFFDLMTTEFGIILDRILAYSNNLMLSLNLEKTQKSLMVSQFIHEYIHEIKTPLTALEGFASAEDLSAKEINKIVFEQTSRIKNLLTNILKIANNQRIRDIKLVNVNQVIESILGLFTDMGKKVREFDSKLPYMYGDYEDLQIVFTNLIKNAREAMFAINRDKRQLTIQTKYLPTSNEIEISVTDTGPGIPEDKLQSIWKRFQTTKLNDGGSGLGLSIIKRIVAEHQGVVNVTSKVGFGTTFKIIFNLVENKKEYEAGLAEKDWRIT